MKKTVYYTACRENGMKIERFATEAEALAMIDEYEDIDREDGTFSDEFYEVIAVEE